MSVKVRINGRMFTFSWAEFEKLNTPHCVEIIDIFAKGGAYASA